MGLAYGESFEEYERAIHSQKQQKPKLDQNKNITLNTVHQ